MIWIAILEVGCVVMFITAAILAIIHDVKHWRNKDNEYNGVIDGRDSDHGNGTEKPSASGDVTERSGDSDASGV